jgi:RimJ/RimL family protein N-acetyltransferase
MNRIDSKDLYTDRLELRIPTVEEQHRLWEILIQEDINQYYFPTPDRIFDKNNLSKGNIEDLKKARQIFMEQLSDWERQKPFYEKKIKDIEDEENSQKFTWSIFLKTGIPIGQITVQQKEEYPDNPEIRDVGWFIDPKYQGHGYGTEAATEVLRFMFEEVEIEKIITSAAIINRGSWRIMEKLGFERVGEKKSTYFDGDNILMSYHYVGDKEKFYNRENHPKAL